MAHVMKGSSSESDQFGVFVRLCENTFNVVREHGHLLITHFIAMLAAGLPELETDTDIYYLRDKLALEVRMVTATVIQLYSSIILSAPCACVSGACCSWLTRTQLRIFEMRSTTRSSPCLGWWTTWLIWRNIIDVTMKAAYDMQANFCQWRSLRRGSCCVRMDLMFKSRPGLVLGGG